MLKLYLVTQTKNDDYDTYDSAVVVSDNEYNAKRIQPSGIEKDWYTWASPEHIKAEYIGEAATTIKSGTVLCASFNAG